MNKTKLLSFFVTFVIMIALTPLIFNKLMNSKFNQMLQNLEKKGIVIKEIEDKSSYLTTDRVFEVIIPGNMIDNSGFIQSVKLNVESVFKNLPVTDVKFFGKILDVVTLDGSFESILKDKINFLVVTPNFKVYRYKIKDNTIDLHDSLLIFKKVEGVFEYPQKNTLKVKNLLFKSKTQPVYFELKNYNNEYMEKESTISQKNSGDFFFSAQNKKLSIFNLRSSTNIYPGKKLRIINSIDFDKADLFSFLSINGFTSRVSIYNLDSALIKEMINADEYKKRALMLKLLEKGFNTDLKANIKTVYLNKQNAGFLDLVLKAKINPVNNLEEKLLNNDISFLDLKLNLKTTPALATFLMNIEPKSAFIFALADKSGGIVKIRFELKNGEVYINGEKIKSN
ncbi:hypothetical protein [Caminibacter sp.]